MPTSAPHSPLNLADALETAVTAAHTAASILQAYSHNRSQLVIDMKARNDLVSQADREAEDAILDILRERTPDFGVIAEESGGAASGLASWFIDPLDGTTNFIHGIPHYAVSIALVARAGTHIGPGAVLKDDMPVVGVIYDPNREELYTAVEGGGAWLNGHRIRTARNTRLEEALVATGLPYRDFSFAEKYMPMLEYAMRHTRGVRRFGSAALDLAWTACGRYDAYWELGLAPWDVAAGTLLVREAGGLAIDLDGRSWPESGNILAGATETAIELGRNIGALPLPAA